MSNQKLKIKGLELELKVSTRRNRFALAEGTDMVYEVRLCQEQAGVPRPLKALISHRRVGRNQRWSGYEPRPSGQYYILKDLLCCLAPLFIYPYAISETYEADLIQFGGSIIPITWYDSSGNLTYLMTSDSVSPYTVVETPSNNQIYLGSNFFEALATVITDAKGSPVARPKECDQCI